MKNKKWMIPTVITLIVVGIMASVGYKIYDMMFNGSVKVQMVDVISAIAGCKVQLIIGGIILFAGIALFIIGKIIKEKTKGQLLTVQGGIAVIVALTVTISWICMGPQYSIVNNVLAGNDEITKEHKQDSLNTALEVAEEGITLLKNEDDVLPMSDKGKINVFGWSSTNPCYGGAGSGSTSTENSVSLIKGLEDAGFVINKDLEKFYTDYRKDRPVMGFVDEDFTVPEPTIEEYNDLDMFENAKDFSETAVIVVTRSSGEGGDLAMSLSEKNNFQNAEQGNPITFSTQKEDLDVSKSYLELTTRERAMIEEVNDNFENVVVIVNSSAAMELGWLDEYENMKGALWCPSPGEVGFEALGKIMNGEVNPSGHVVDTFVYDLLSIPAIHNFGSFSYENYEDVTGSKENKSVFVNYNEGIYVGYKFYETAAAEGLIDYDSVVQFPFGYGLSYTDFSAEIENVEDDGTTISIDVKVENKGTAAGKYVAQIYYNPPYNNGGIEKATANLVGFAKTGLIKAGGTETVNVQFGYEDMASYDSDRIKSKNGAYVLEAGNYEINLCSDAHTVLDTYTAEVDSDIIYDNENEGKRSTDNTVSENQFDYGKGDVTYLSRADHFANYEAAVEGPSDFTLSDEAKETYASAVTFDAADYDDENVEMPVTGAENGLTIQEMEGLSYDDPKWNDLLDQLTVEELKNLVADGTYHAVVTKSINLPYVIDTDGPSGINSFFTGNRGTAFPAPVMLAATWNVELADAVGTKIAQELTDFGMTGWYGPGMNIHRTAFSGRNFEYYSEDGLLSGKMAASEVRGARELGIITYIKHFALNDSETDRAKGICTWSTEQAVREIYLKPFELAVKEGGSNGIMNSKNAIGTKWVGANEELMVNVLKKEWGFVGCVMTDALDTVSKYYQDPNEAVRAGTDKMLSASIDESYWYDESTGTVTALRNEAHNYLYALANSNAMDINTGMPVWFKAFITADILIVLLLAAWEVYAVKRFKKNRKQSAGEKHE